VIVDTSAIVAMLRAESDAAALSKVIRGAAVLRLSAASYVELAVVIDGLGDPVLSGGLDAVLTAYRIRIEPLTESQARIARAAYQRFGRGSGHPARLNMGDCFAYALARDLDEPLLFKGNDFRLTDIEIVTEPIRHKRLSEIVASYGISAP
jgi:ribonuclease VapC